MQYEHFILPPRAYSAYFDDTFLKPEECETDELEETVRFCTGGHYTLTTEACDGFPSTTKTYECKGVVKAMSGVDINSVIMKQIDGDSGAIFSLTKADCKILGVTFEDGLQLFPESMGWEKVNDAQSNNSQEDEKPRRFTPDDLSTYPVDYETKKICHMLLKIHLSTCETITQISALLPQVATTEYLEIKSIRYRFIKDTDIVGTNIIEVDLPYPINPILLANKKASDLFAIRCMRPQRPSESDDIIRNLGEWCVNSAII